MIYLLTSLALLALGPALAAAGRRARGTTTALDAFALVTLGGLVFLHILPHELADGGLLALAAGATAFVLTGRAERSLHHCGHDGSHATASATGKFSRAAVPVLALLGLGLHAVVDGFALAGGELALDGVTDTGHAHDHGHGHGHGDGHGHAHAGHGHGPAEAGASWIVAVLAHRLPMTLSLWWIVAPALGVRAAIVTMATLGVGTTIGFFLGQEVMASATPESIAIFEALLAGTLLHVVLHADLPAPAHGQPSDRLRWLATLIGLTAGAALVVAVEGSHDHGGDVPGPAGTFVDLALESAPALLMAYAALVFVHRFVPSRALLGRAGRGSSITQALRGVAVGVPLPVCSCGVVPLYRGLVQGGSSPVAGIAFLIATPEIELAAILLTVQLLGPEVAIARVIAAVAVAVFAAMLVARTRAVRAAASEQAADADATESSPTEGVAAPEGTSQKAPSQETPSPTWAQALRHGFGDSVDDTAAWVLIGLGIAALLSPHLDPAWLGSLPSLAAVPAAALLGMPLYVCASGSTPLAAVLIAGGLSPGAAIAFLLTGPATNATTFGVLRRMHGRQTAVIFGIAVFVGASLTGLATDAALRGNVAVRSADGAHHVPGSDVQWACLIAVGLLFLLSVLRRGPRGFLAHVLQSPNLTELRSGGDGGDCHVAHAGHGHHHHHGHDDHHHGHHHHH